MDMIFDAFCKKAGNDIPLAILQSDFEAAFDAISQLFIYDLMSTIGFHPGLINSIKVLYSGAQANPLVNNIETQPINVSSGTPQGDCVIKSI